MKLLHEPFFVFRNEEYVSVIRAVDNEIRKIHVHRFENRDSEVVVEFIQLDPLHEQAVVG